MFNPAHTHTHTAARARTHTHHARYHPQNVSATEFGAYILLDSANTTMKVYLQTGPTLGVPGMDWTTAPMCVLASCAPPAAAAAAMHTRTHTRARRACAPTRTGGLQAHTQRARAQRGRQVPPSQRCRAMRPPHHVRRQQDPQPQPQDLWGPHLAGYPPTTGVVQPKSGPVLGEVHIK